MLIPVTTVMTMSSHQHQEKAPLLKHAQTTTRSHDRVNVDADVDDFFPLPVEVAAGRRRSRQVRTALRVLQVVFLLVAVACAVLFGIYIHIR